MKKVHALVDSRRQSDGEERLGRLIRRLVYLLKRVAVSEISPTLAYAHALAV
jgi:hypothetical protein